MNAQMRLVIMLTSVAVSGSLLFAAEPARQPPAEPAAEPRPDAGAQPEAQPPAKSRPKADETAAKSAGETAPSKDDEKPSPKPVASTADKAGTPQRFTPSEQVRADFDVSFPIDI